MGATDPRLSSAARRLVGELNRRVRALSPDETRDLRAAIGQLGAREARRYGLSPFNLRQADREGDPSLAGRRGLGLTAEEERLLRAWLGEVDVPPVTRDGRQAPIVDALALVNRAVARRRSLIEAAERRPTPGEEVPRDRARPTEPAGDEAHRGRDEGRD